MIHHRQPAEWAHHSAVWLAWPSDTSLWKENLQTAQTEFQGLCQAIACIDPLTKKALGERLEILVPNEIAEQLARSMLYDLPANYHHIPFGDIWLRDTAPIFVQSAHGAATVRFRFNGWGNKYMLDHDAAVAASIARTAKIPDYTFPWVFEGGSIDVDGEGTCITTRQCLLNKNRNPDMTQGQIEAGLRDALGIEKVLWLQDGLINDHTDGHVDTIARFVAPRRVVCMEALDPNDPNKEVLAQIAHDLSTFTDHQGRLLEVIKIPSPGIIGDSMPASYVNFYIGNSAVVVPTYGSPYDQAAVAALVPLFPGRHVCGMPARAILTGGGAFHCITQQQVKL